MIILLITLATIITTLLGGLFALYFKDKLHLIMGFSAGAVLGVALFELIPESLELTKNLAPSKTMAFAALGFSFYLILDRFFSLHNHHDEKCENPHHNGHFGAAALSLHSFLDGLGIGLAFKVSTSIGWIVAIAVLAHDFSDGINTVTMMILDKGNKKAALRWLTVDALAPALGVSAAFFFTIPSELIGLSLATFVGLFLYISASDLIPESHHRHPTLLTSLMTILGIGLIYLVSRLA
jgi:ZIP family zinc transporter